MKSELENKVLEVLSNLQAFTSDTATSAVRTGWDGKKVGLEMEAHRNTATEALEALIEDQCREAKIEVLNHIKWYMEDAISMHKTPTRVVARLGSTIGYTEKLIAELTKEATDDGDSQRTSNHT